MSDLLGQVTSSATALGNLLLVTPNTDIGYQPQDPDASFLQNLFQPSQPALLFNYEGENTTTLESDITDHYTENNSSIQDQIALRPVIITTQGFIGELNNVPPTAGLQILQQIANKLTTISAYAPGLSTTALLAYNEALLGYKTVQNAVNGAVSAYNTITGTAGTDIEINGNVAFNQINQTQQQKYFQLFYGYWNSRTLFTVQTPWAVFENMAIRSLKAIQSAETRMITDFEVSFKQINYAAVIQEAQLYNNAAAYGAITSANAVFGGLNRAGLQVGPVTNLGSSAATPSTIPASSTY